MEPIKWEYKVYINNPDLEDVNIAEILRKHGDDGWELVAVIGESKRRYGVLYFKRPKVEE